MRKEELAKAERALAKAQAKLAEFDAIRAIQLGRNPSEREVKDFIVAAIEVDTEDLAEIVRALTAPGGSEEALKAAVDEKLK